MEGCWSKSKRKERKKSGWGGRGMEEWKKNGKKRRGKERKRKKTMNKNEWTLKKLLMLSKSNIMQRIEIHLDKVKDKRCKDKEREKKKEFIKKLWNTGNVL